MKKTTYSATFSDGTSITRNSAREYSHAWQVNYYGSRSDGSDCATKTGFAASKTNAEKAVRAEAAFFASLGCTVTATEVQPVTVEGGAP